MFIGEYNANIDDNHRVMIPSSFKKYLEETLVIAKGFEKCLYLFNQTDWIALSEKINNLSITKSINRQFSRGLNSGAYESSLDSKGRIVLSQKLLDHAGLNKEVVVIGVSNRIEIWDKQEWDKMTADDTTLATLSEELDL